MQGRPVCKCNNMEICYTQLRRRQVPTFRADPLTPSCDTWCEFPVSDRPNAVAQFLRAARRDPSMIKARRPAPPLAAATIPSAMKRSRS